MGFLGGVPHKYALADNGSRTVLKNAKNPVFMRCFKTRDKFRDKIIRSHFVNIGPCTPASLLFVLLARAGIRILIHDPSSILRPA